MIQKKKYAKAAKIIPEGYESANKFFESVFEDKEMIWMGQNTNELHIGHNQKVHDAMIECIESDEYNKYPPPEGFTELQSLILKDLELEDLSIYINAGATESLYLAMNAVLSKGDNVITPDPGYLIIDNFASRFASEVRDIPIYSEENQYKLTPKLVRENMDENTKVILLIDPLNPLGSSYTEDEIKEFAEIAIENNLFLLHDVTYRDFAQEHTLAAKYAPDNTITTYSFSKIFGMAGLRLGAIVSSQEVIDVVKSIIINDVGTSMVAQAGAMAALKTKDEWIERVNKTTFENQKIIKEAVDECEGVFLPVYPSSANMMAIDLSGAGIDPEDMSQYLIDRKVFTRQGSYTSTRFGNNYLRVSYSISPEKVKVFAREFKLAVEALRTK
ncbi:pyridoxal phosphate-dependent aminotransferase [uncultured Methanobrevibacter sp.]|uniref:pyridoxal phosphate-dependent aminotransferase n=1 Tax=uncultured Methanobrevibacter sp. TaxID=253161 RepID=UPI00263832FA